MDPSITCQNVIVGADCAGGHHREIHGDRYFFDGGDDEGYESEEDAEDALALHRHYMLIASFYAAAGRPMAVTDEERKHNDKMFDRDHAPTGRRLQIQPPKQKDPLPWFRRETEHQDRLGGHYGADEE